MRKVKKLWIKQEKRIVTLLYKKGLINEFKLKDLYWAEYHHTGKTYKSKNYRQPEFLPEIHFWSGPDYFGDYDEHSLVSHVIDYLYWENVVVTDEGEVLRSDFKHTRRKSFLKYLQTLPTVKSDNKINKVVKIMRPHQD